MERRGIPRRPIFWTLDQIADMLALSVPLLQRSYIWHDGKDAGLYRPHFLKAVNIKAGAVRLDNAHPEWRVAETEFLRWLSFHQLWILDPLSVAQVAPATPPERRPVKEPTGILVDLQLPSSTEEHA